MVPTIQDVARYAGVSRSTASHALSGKRGLDVDFAEPARILVDHLAERGHREIILITSREHVFERGGAYSWRFRDAALQCAASYGIRVRCYFGEAQQPAVNQQLNQILDMRDEPAMVVRNDAPAGASPWRVDLVAPHITDRGSTR